jgi:uracil-DNA glycosylase
MTAASGAGRRRQLPQLLAEHRAALRECRACGLEGVRPIVSEATAPQVMLVGQAPGRVEERGGAAFSGRAGRTLFKWFASIGLGELAAREQIYFAAITRCYPGAGTSGRGDRVPSPAERGRCSHWLDSELEIIRPRLIIPVGRLAIDRFLGSSPLDELIGLVHFREIGSERVRLIPLPHPSGASSWFNLAANKELLGSALEHLRRQLRTLGIIEVGASRGAA